jgi:hypothetical protein
MKKDAKLHAAAAAKGGGVLLVAVLLVLSLLSAAGWSAKAKPEPQEVKPAAAAPATPIKKTVTPSPDPRLILQKMCNLLKSQQQFSYKAEVADDEVYYGGKKLQYEIDLETFVRRPDHLRVNADGDLVNKEFFFNGKTITLYDKDQNVYGTMEVPPNIEGALEKANKDFGVRVALTDLASPDLWELLNKRIKHSLYVGQSKIRGVLCHHLSFDGDKVQLQVWIEAGNQPRLRKVVLTHKKLPGEPQWTAYLSDWNFSPQLSDSLFAFTPPQGAQKIKFVPVQAARAPKSKPEKKKKGGKS